MGGVDWNNFEQQAEELKQASPPTWVVWIEILFFIFLYLIRMSPPTWVVWIEIEEWIYNFFGEDVTTHMGGVDWNC